MYLSEAKYRIIKLFHKNYSPLFLRISFYFLIALLYYYFMNTYSPLGLAWRPFHYERVVNALQNIVENPELNFFGYTSWSDIETVNKAFESNRGNIYLVPLIGYIFYSFCYKFIPNFDLLAFGSILDFLLISILGFLIAELGLYVISIKTKFESMFYGVILFSTFITSPWAYRMIIAPWNEVHFLIFYLISIFFFINNKKYFGLLFIFLAGLIHWIWIFFLMLFSILIKVINIFLGNLLDQNCGSRYLPKPIQNKKGFSLYLIACSLPIIFYEIQNYLLRIKGIEHSGSNPLFRVGIDNFSNIHHGGIIAAFQFLGGNRFSQCFLVQNTNNLSNTEKYINYFNCSTSILSMVLLSLISIVGLILFLKNSNQAKWIFFPLTWSLFLYCLLFQQSFAVHLQGYSIIFAFIFTINLVYFFKYIEKIISIPKSIFILILIPIFTGILINSIRVSYLTGING